MIKTKTKYRHFKGKEYEVIAIATHSETLEKNGRVSRVIRRGRYMGKTS